MPGYRLRITSLVVAAMIVCLAPAAMAQRVERLRFNDDAKEDLKIERVRRGAMVPARPFFRYMGGDIECTRDGYCVRRGGHTYRFRPGTRVYYYDETPRYFPGAPFVRGGQLYVPPEPFIDDWGGRFYYDRGWNASFPGYWTGPGRLRLDSPRPDAILRTNYVIVDGYATPYRDLQVLLYWFAPYEPAHGRIIYTTPLRVQANGYYQTRLPLAGNGRYRAVVQLLNDLGGIEEEAARVFEAR